MHVESARSERHAGVEAMGALARWLQGGGFPLFTLTLLGLGLAGTAAMLAVPVSDGPLGRFAADFKTWCFGWDAATGGVESTLVASMLVGPLPLMALVAVLWREPLREALARGWRAWAPPAGAAVAALGIGASAFALAPQPPSMPAEPPFPAEDLRTHFAAPDFSVTDHEGGTLRLADLRGRVVMVTAVYAGCSTKCPMIMAQAKSVVAALSPEERRDLTVVALTLDPVTDRPERLREMAAGHLLDPATWRLATSDPAAHEKLLDAYGFARSRDEKTGVIDHANLFQLIDREGRLAYRLTLGDLQQRWTIEGLRVLLAERPGES